MVEEDNREGLNIRRPLLPRWRISKDTKSTDRVTDRKPLRILCDECKQRPWVSTENDSPTTTVGSHRPGEPRGLLLYCSNPKSLDLGDD